MRSFAAIAVLTFLFTIATSALADEDAAAAYDRGAAAYDRGDFVTAAAELARADELTPSAVTLELALNAVVRADDPVLGMTLVERAEKRREGSQTTQTPTLDGVARSARRKFEGRVGKLNVVCRASSSDTGESGTAPASPSCETMLDGKPFTPNAPRFVIVGAHRVTVTRGLSSARATPSQSFDVVIEAGKTVELIPPTSSLPAGSAPTSPSTRPSSSDDTRGVSPTWFWIGVGATTVVGGITLVSGLDTVSKHDSFAADRSDANLAGSGRAADQRTVFLLIGTGALALATAAMGLFVVDWKSESPKRATTTTTTTTMMTTTTTTMTILSRMRGVMVF